MNVAADFTERHAERIRRVQELEPLVSRALQANSARTLWTVR